jgi:hypothetical protein
MRFFDSEKECREVVLSYLEDLSEESKIDLQVTIARISERKLSSKEKIYRITYVFRECLWDIPEAVEIGFYQWMRKHIPVRIDALKYHGVSP